MSNFVPAGAKNPRKQEYVARLIEILKTYNKCLVVGIDNVSANQIAKIRYALRGKASVVFGKNTVIKYTISRLMDENPLLKKLDDLVAGNIGLIFCNDDLVGIKDVVTSFKIPAAARPGMVAPCDVVVPAMSTGMDPGQTSFFQSLGIPTKIFKGQIEIQNDVHLIHVGEKVNASQATLLQKLKILPFSYSVVCLQVYDEGSVYPASILDMKADEIVESMKSFVASAAALSLGSGIPSTYSIRSLLSKVYVESLCLAMAAGADIPELECLKSAAPAASSTADVKEDAPAAKEESEEEEEDLALNMFF